MIKELTGNQKDKSQLTLSDHQINKIIADLFQNILQQKIHIRKRLHYKY
jgi:hypothetical protein